MACVAGRDGWYVAARLGYSTIGASPAPRRRGAGISPEEPRRSAFAVFLQGLRGAFKGAYRPAADREREPGPGGREEDVPHSQGTGGSCGQGSPPCEGGLRDPRGPVCALRMNASSRTPAARPCRPAVGLPIPPQPQGRARTSPAFERDSTGFASCIFPRGMRNGSGGPRDCAIPDGIRRRANPSRTQKGPRGFRGGDRRGRRFREVLPVDREGRRPRQLPEGYFGEMLGPAVDHRFDISVERRIVRLRPRVVQEPPYLLPDGPMGDKD